MGEDWEKERQRERVRKETKSNKISAFSLWLIDLLLKRDITETSKEMSI